MVAQRRAQWDTLRSALTHHTFMPYSDREIRCLCNVIARWALKAHCWIPEEDVVLAIVMRY